MTKYVDKDRLHDELVTYLNAKEQGKTVKPSDYIGKAIIDIAYGLSNKYNFRNYTWLDEMIEDGILAATKAIDKYDPQRMTESGTPNPYGYFTQCIYWAFQNRITAENNQLDLKVAYMTDALTEFYVQDGGENVSISKEHIVQMLQQNE